MVNLDKIVETMFLYEKVTSWAFHKQWRNWSQAINYAICLCLGGFLGAAFLYAFVASLFSFNHWLLDFGYHFIAGFPCIWLMFLSMHAGHKIADFASAIPYGKPYKITLSDKISVKFWIWYRKNIKHFGEHELVNSFSKYPNNENPLIYATIRKYALKSIFNIS